MLATTTTTPALARGEFPNTSLSAASASKVSPPAHGVRLGWAVSTRALASRGEASRLFFSPFLLTQKSRGPTCA